MKAQQFTSGTHYGGEARHIMKCVIVSCTAFVSGEIFGTKRCGVTVCRYHRKSSTCGALQAPSFITELKYPSHVYESLSRFWLRRGVLAPELLAELSPRLQVSDRKGGRP